MVTAVRGAFVVVVGEKAVKEEGHLEVLERRTVEEGEDDIVLEMHGKGYLLGNDVLRWVPIMCHSGNVAHQ